MNTEIIDRLVALGYQLALIQCDVENCNMEYDQWEIEHDKIRAEIQQIKMNVNNYVSLVDPW